MDRLITLKNDKRTVFVGDIHGDLRTLEKLFQQFELNDGTRFVFLGDYIDRGKYSDDVVGTLLTLREICPDKIILLLGNHELGDVGDFWSDSRCRKYERAFENLPLAVELGNIIATHGALPILNNIKNFNDIKVELNTFEIDQQLQLTVWGDVDGYHTGREANGSRPCLSQEHIDKALAGINKKILIRGHDPKNPTVSMNGKCITILATDLYTKYWKHATPKVVVVEAGENPETAQDLKIVELNNGKIV